MSDKFLRLFSHKTPALQAKFRSSDADVTTIKVQHRLGACADQNSIAYLDSVGSNEKLAAFRQFYAEHDGAEICRIHDPRVRRVVALLDLKPAFNIAEFSDRYAPHGDLAWTIDLNKSRTLYRSSDSWIAFAAIHGGPACLTMFLDGENAGSIFYVTPQPEFNTLKPIAKGFHLLLERVAKDLPAFLRLVRATVTVRGSDGQFYGFAPVGYLDNFEQDVRKH